MVHGTAIVLVPGLVIVICSICTLVRAMKDPNPIVRGNKLAVSGIRLLVIGILVTIVGTIVFQAPNLTRLVGDQ